LPEMIHEKFFSGTYLPLDFSLTIEIHTPGAQAMGAPREAGVAQSVEQLICNQQVAGSSPISSSTKETLGGVPERPKGTDCKSVGEAFGGSNPPPSTISSEGLQET
jgi:hypothetical protein